MSKMKTLIEATDIPEFKVVLQNWDDSHSSDEAANEIAKVLKGQQPKVFLTWLIGLSDQQISPGKFKLKKDIIQESVRLLGDILVEKSNDSSTKNSPQSLSCSVCASPAQQDFTLVGLEKDVEKIMQTIVELKMHWICSLCKDKLENIKMVDCGENPHEEIQTKSLEINKTGEESSDAVEAETSSLAELAINLEIGTDVQGKIQNKADTINQLVQSTTITQTLQKQTTNQEVQTIIQELETETENQQTLNKPEKELLNERTSNVMDSKETLGEVIETKDNSTQTDKKIEEEEYRTKIEREVQIAYEIKMVQEKQQRSKELSKKSELKQKLELDKCQLEMENCKLEIEKHDLFVEKYKMDQFGLYRVRKTLKPIKHQKDSVSDVEKKVVKLRNKLENILDNGGDWRDTLDILKKLDKIEDMNLDILTSTKIVWTVNDLRRYSRHPEVVEFARRVVKRLNRMMPSIYREKQKDQRKTSKDREELALERNHDYRGKYEDDNKTMKFNEKMHSDKSKNKSVLETIEISDSEQEKENKGKQHDKDIQNFTKTFDNLQIIGQNKMEKAERDVMHVCDVACINGHK